MKLINEDDNTYTFDSIVFLYGYIIIIRWVKLFAHVPISNKKKYK